MPSHHWLRLLLWRHSLFQHLGPAWCMGQAYSSSQKICSGREWQVFTARSHQNEGTVSAKETPAGHRRCLIHTDTVEFLSGNVLPFPGMWQFPKTSSQAVGFLYWHHVMVKTELCEKPFLIFSSYLMEEHRLAWNSSMICFKITISDSEMGDVTWPRRFYNIIPPSKPYPSSTMSRLQQGCHSSGNS